MSVHVQFEDFEKMVLKECKKLYGLTPLDIPNDICEKYWKDNMCVKEAKEAMTNCISEIVDLISL
jgi:hypothetical protein